MTSSSVTASTKAAAPVTVVGDTKTVTAKNSAASSVLKTVTSAVKSGPVTSKTALLGHTGSSSGLTVPKELYRAVNKNQASAF